MRYLILILILTIISLFTSVACTPKDGINGKDGTGCKVEAQVNGTLITCPTSSTFIPKDDSVKINKIVKPCSYSKEVLLVTSEKQVLAFFRSGSHEYLAVLPNGSYQTTDGTNCKFNVLEGEVYEN